MYVSDEGIEETLSMKLFPKLLTCFLVIAILPFSFFLLFTYNNLKSVILKEGLKDLKGYMNAKIEYLTGYFVNLEKDAAFVAKSPYVVNSLNELDAQKKNPSSLNQSRKKFEELTQYFSFFTQVFSLDNVYLIDSEGNIIFSKNKERYQSVNIFKDKHINSELEKLFNSLKSKKTHAISSFKYYEPAQKEVIFIGAPIIEEGTFRGIFCFTIPPTQINKLFSDYTQLRATGESLVAERDGDNLVFVIPIRRNKNAAFNLTIPFGSNKALPMQKALNQEHGEGISYDYRGKKVLAVWRYFPITKWGLVAKIDLDEVYKPAYELRNNLLLIVFFTLVIVIIAVVLISRSLSNPIKKLQEASIGVQSGHYPEKLYTKGSDEIALLSQSFDTMIEELKTSTTSIEKLNEEVEQRKIAEQLKTEFISVISHELRTPIGPIKEGVALVLEEQLGPLNDQQKEFLNITKNNANRLHILINDLLDFQKLESGRYDFQFEMGNLNEIAKEISGLFQTTVNEKKIELKLELAENLPETRMDTTKISQVFSNLISNAVKFTDQGQIIVKTSVNNEFIKVDIIDSGLGIESEEMSKLFESFRQLKSTSEKKKMGTGIGLAIAKKIVTAHEGKIWATSEHGKGSTFSFVIPIKSQEESKEWEKKS